MDLLTDCSKANKMGFPVKLQCLNLTPLEERLIGGGGQLSILGNVVNVPADVNSTVSTLPRSIDESQTIIHTQPLKYIKNLSEITISEPTQRHNYGEQ